MLADGFILWGIPSGAKIDKNVAVRAQAYQLSLLARGTSNLVAEGDGNHANLTDTACRVPTTSAVYVILNQRSTPGGAKVNKVKNLSIRVIRYFTSHTFRSV